MITPRLYAPEFSLFLQSARRQLERRSEMFFFYYSSFGRAYESIFLLHHDRYRFIFHRGRENRLRYNEKRLLLRSSSKTIRETGISYKNYNNFPYAWSRSFHVRRRVVHIYKTVFDTENHNSRMFTTVPFRR